MRLSVDIINGACKVYISRTLYVIIDTPIVDMYMFWYASLESYKNALQSKIPELTITSYKLTNNCISINGEDIKPYCYFTLAGSNIWLKKHDYYIYNEPFIALSAAIDGRNLLY
jgi:hypothetical protein